MLFKNSALTCSSFCCAIAVDVGVAVVVDGADVVVAVDGGADAVAVVFSSPDL